ncbi:Calx-beta domain-containing protein, partial [Chitinophaga silvisoli]
ANIDVTVIDDQTIEADETVIATLTAATAPTLGTFTANTSATVTIADDENKTISIVNTANASEPATNGSFTVSLPAGVTAAEDISVTYTVSGTATAGTDYTTLSGTVTIPAGANSTSIDVTVIDDQTIEADEIVIATITTATAPTLGTFTANTSATITIADDENKTISIVNTANASEPATNGSFTVSLPAGVTAAEDISVTYTVAGTATASTDYNTLSGTVTIPAGANSTSINVTVIDDQTIEADETVIATLTAATAPTLGTFNANTSATINIADDENKTISIVNTVNASEPATNGSFTVSLPTGVTATEDITVTYTTSGTATAGTDYTSLSGTATIPAGTNSANIDVTVIDDKIIEGNETIAVTLTGATANTLGTFTANTSATVTIADDDLQIINITTTNDASEPATNGTFTVSLPTGVTSTQNITVTYTVSGTATAGTDYTTLSGTVTIPAGANNTNIDVPVTDDKIIEGNETVILTINDATASSATMAISDDDVATISLTKSADAAEPATNGTFTLSLPAGLTSTTDILVPYTVSGTATTGVDYTTLSGMATIPAGSNSATINVTVIDDKMIETNETVILTLADGSSATLTITDDEDATISITKTNDAAEPSTNGAFTVSLPTGITSATAITVPYTISGTATAGADYTTLTGNVIIPAGQNSAAINVNMLDDKIIEGNETVILTLTDVTKTATLTITDDENQTISITKTANAAEPATNGSFTVSLPAGVTSTQNISVPYTVSGTATAGTDYTALTGSVIIPAGSNNASITVNVIDDQLIEGSETVILTLTDVTKTATLTITDNDLPTFSIVKTADAAEPTTNGSFTLSYPPNITAYEDVTITYTISGTATAGTDYTALTGSVTIPAGKNSAVIAVNVIDDLVYEGNENITITLNGASGATLGSLSASGTASLTIADNDLPPLSIVKTADAAEPSTNGGFVISTAAAYTVTSPITVTYTIAGTANNGTDYSTMSGTITIPAGANSITLPVNVIDNYKADGTRTVILTLVSGTDGTNTYQPGTDYTATVNITDNDVANYQAWKVASVPSTNPDGKIQPGQVITYTIYVRNTSNTAIGPLTITDKIPTNTNWESGGSLASGVVSFSIPSLAAGAVTQVSFQVKTYENLDGVPSINNTAHVSDGFNKIPTYACDPQTATCDTVTKVIVRPAKGDLTITKTVAAPGPYVIEDYITYNIVVKNVGYSSFTNLVIVDSLPYNLDLPYHTTTTKGSTAFSVSPRKVTWYVNELVPGDSVFITVTCRILAGDHVINTAYVWANEGEADYTNNTDINKEETSNKDLYFINAFRPGAAQNNKFVIVGIEKYPGSHLLVYSRWGNVVFESKNYNNDWTADNIPMGEYIYKVVVPKKTGKFTYSGTVLIIK